MSRALPRTAPVVPAAALVTLLFPAPLLAGTDSGLYAGFGLGRASVELDPVDGFGFDDEDAAWKLIGGYNFGWIPLVDLAAEASYVDFGTPDDDGVEVDAKGVSVVGLAGVNFGLLGAFAKLGGIAWDADFDGPSGSSGDDGFDPAWGLGVRANLFSFQLRAEYEYFDIDASDEVSLISASFIYTF